MARKAAKKTKKPKAAKKAPASPATAKKKSTKASKAAKPRAAKKATRKPAAMMSDVRELVGLLTANDLTEIRMESGDMKIVLRRGPASTEDSSVSVAPSAVAAPAEAPAPEAPAETDDLIDIASPMVGTFYAAADPDSDDYATVGAKISSDTVVCIIEAMKVMNEIKADCSGTIVEVCVANAQPVEFGQTLFRVKPA